MSITNLNVKWFDEGRDPVCAPDPSIPNGIDLDCSGGARRSCQVKLPYPAPRCGKHVVDCPVCGLVAIASAAGRPDDPRSLKVACKIAETKS